MRPATGEKIRDVRDSFHARRPGTVIAVGK